MEPPQEGPALLLHLSTDANEINAAINDPSVRPFVGAPEAGELDVSPLIRPENLFPFGEHGGFLLQWTAPHTYEVHTFIREDGRGRWARIAASDGIKIAAEHGATHLWTKIPPNAQNVRLFAAMMGMQPTGEVIEALGEPFEIYGMTVH